MLSKEINDFYDIKKEEIEEKKKIYNYILKLTKDEKIAITYGITQIRESFWTGFHEKISVRDSLYEEFNKKKRKFLEIIKTINDKLYYITISEENFDIKHSLKKEYKDIDKYIKKLKKEIPWWSLRGAMYDSVNAYRNNNSHIMTSLQPLSASNSKRERTQLVIEQKKSIKKQINEEIEFINKKLSDSELGDLKYQSAQVSKKIQKINEEIDELIEFASKALKSNYDHRIENGYKELYDIYQGKGYTGDYFDRYRAIDIWGKVFQKLTLSKMKEEVKNSEGYIKLKVIKLN